MPTRDQRLQFSPHAQQRRVLHSDARFRVVAAGRRGGKTKMAVFATLARALEAGDGWRGYWVGAEHHHALTAFNLVDATLPESVVARRKESPPRVIEHVDGWELEFHSAGGGSLVSVGLDWAVCDEAAKDFPKRTWTQELRPALSDQDGEAMFISTPDGRGWFYERYQRGGSPDYSEWASFRWPSYDNPGVADSEINAAKDDIPDRIFEQEYLAAFLDETGGVFEGLQTNLFTSNYDFPESGVDPQTEWVTSPFSIGVDLARHEDYRVIIVLDAGGRVVHFDREREESWPQIQRAVHHVAERYPGLVSIDASRDNKLVADLEAAGLRIEPVKFTSQRKTALIENLVGSIENGELAAPEIDALKSELEVFEYDVTRAGNVKYNAPQGFHDDCVDALALANDGLRHAEAAPTATVSKSDTDGHDAEGIMGAIREQARQNTEDKWK